MRLQMGHFTDVQICLSVRWMLSTSQTAIIAYTPVYQLFLSDNDFWRASNSLQLDETIAVYIARLIGNADHLFLARNAHPPALPRYLL